ncbi:hypothetical protein [Rhodovulum kholense]|uniref:Uncharacterized protein n=1 Tax=Rhodovulum kholense TaxID=453584 RepID=A0A8E2VIL5_9RHOB|nr:hypothetical protein [Rhodovulum kholense]PTW47792.1 hypothetical protein C8N38_109150 [Rhodovulum kholense]
MIYRPIAVSLTAITPILGGQAALAKAPSTVHATYRAASADQALARGKKIADLFTLNMTTPHVLQKLTDRTCWYRAGFYGTTWYLGA